MQELPSPVFIPRASGACPRPDKTCLGLLDSHKTNEKLHLDMFNNSARL